MEVHRGVFLRAYLESAANPPPMERIAVCEAATLALRGLSHAWQFRKGWERRTAHMLELAFERLSDPDPKSGDEWVTE